MASRGGHHPIETSCCYFCYLVIREIVYIKILNEEIPYRETALSALVLCGNQE